MAGGYHELPQAANATSAGATTDGEVGSTLAGFEGWQDHVRETVHGFAVLALLTACVGLYGTMSYGVARQVGEIGIRMALGAQRGAIVRMVLRRVVLLAAVGLAIGVPAASIAFRLVTSLLFETQPNDPGTMALAGLALLSAAILADYAPARRASRVDPLAALRQE